jgi:hypothetical protein
MDFSQYIRLKNEAANVYAARTKTVDASFLTYKRNQKAAYSGYTDIQRIPYFNGAPVVNPVLYDTGSCPADQQMTDGYTTVNKQIQNEAIALRKAGCAVCSDPDYSKTAPGVQLMSYQEQSTIITSYNNLTPAPGDWKPYGYGEATFFPKPDVVTNPVYPPAAWPYK